MILRKVSLDNKSDLEFVEKLYIESFPPNERRPVLEMHHIMEEESRFSIFLLLDSDDVRIGFIAYWEFESFIFLEHFAISPEYRNSGYGRRSIEAVIQQTTLPLLAEIELPSTSDYAARRLKFYENIGFRVWDIPYAQPPYEIGNEAIPMLLLTYRNLDLEKNIDTVKNQLFKSVYKNA